MSAIEMYTVGRFVAPASRHRLLISLSRGPGNDSPQVAPPTGAPAITVPMGFVHRSGRSALPAGLQMLARPWDEGRLLRVAFAYEQATLHRRLVTCHLSAHLNAYIIAFKSRASSFSLHWCLHCLVIFACTLGFISANVSACIDYFHIAESLCFLGSLNLARNSHSLVASCGRLG